MCRSWACGWSSARPASRPAARTPRSTSSAARGASSPSATSTSASTEHHTVIEGSMRVKLYGKAADPRPGRRDHDPARHAAHAEARRRAVRTDPHPPDAERPQRRVLRAARRARLQPPRLPQARSRPRVRPRAGRCRPRRSPEPEDPAAARRAARQRVHVRRRVGRRRRARGRLRHARRRHHLPALVEARLHRRRATTASTPHQHFKGRLPYHLHTRTRTIRSERPHRARRARPTATCAAPASGP